MSRVNVPIEKFNSDLDDSNFDFLSIYNVGALEIFFNNMFEQLKIDLSDAELLIKLKPTDEDEYLDFNENDNVNFVELYYVKNSIENQINLLDIYNDYDLDLKEVVRGEGGSCFEEAYNIDFNEYPPGEGYKKVIQMDLENLKNRLIVKYSWMPT